MISAVFLKGLHMSVNRSSCFKRHGIVSDDTDLRCAAIAHPALFTSGSAPFLCFVECRDFVQDQTGQCTPMAVLLV